MALVISPPPKGWQELTQTPEPFGLSRRSLIPPQAASTNGRAAARDMEHLELSNPLPVVVVEFQKALKSLEKLSSGQPTRWCALCLNGGEAAATLDFEEGPDHALQLVKTTSGEQAQRLAEALEAAVTLPEASTAGYSLRLLDFPSISLKVLWLRKDGAPFQEDLFISLSATEKLRRYSADELIETALDLFQKRAQDWANYRKSRSFRWAIRDTFETLQQGFRRRFSA
jgi:hypothetical protein